MAEMAPRPRKAAKGREKDLKLAPDWLPTQAVEEPVINPPYVEPSWHWIYKGQVPSKQPGRRPASYWYKTKKVAAAQEEFFAEEEREELPLVNRLRKDVKRWRDSGYRGATTVTKDLFAYWFRDDRPLRLFFCQREAVETLIYLLEIAIPGRLSATAFRNFEVDQVSLDRLLRGEKPAFEEFTGDFFPRLVDDPEEAGLLPLRRLGCKMATGSGKTIVMGMVITWAFCNRGRNPATSAFPNGVVVCAPNLTVRKRLDVLKPEDPNNYYRAFDLVPAKYQELLNAGKVLVTNWHTFGLKSEHSEGGVSYRVVNKGEETPEAFTKGRLNDLANRLPILVLNDEGHHCWRPKVDPELKGLSKEEKATIEEELEEARVWLAGLDRINNCGIIGKEQHGILAAIDLSATPFYLAASGYPEGSPFPWLVSDFGLVDAIECGIVKIPRLPVKDDTGTTDEAGRPDPKYFRLWRHIDEHLNQSDRLSNGRPKPEAVYREAETALQTLASQWRKRFQEIQASTPGQPFTPPVLIVVCDNTEISQIFFEKLSGERQEQALGEDGKETTVTKFEGSTIFPEFSNTEEFRPTVRIDTKLLAKIETSEEQTKDEAAQALRQIIDTVGKRGGPGEQVRCVVSVGMLTEGWDATNVTHILGVRAFGSQLLCEQVVGRGLRRMSYTPDPQTGMLAAEYVDVYGIPFSLIPFKGKPTDGDGGVDVIYHHIFAVTPDRDRHEIRIPVVEGYTYDLRGAGIHCDVNQLEPFAVNHEPTEVFLAPTRGYVDHAKGQLEGEFIRQTREEYLATVRWQQVLFRLTQLVVDDLVAGATGEGVERLRQNLYSRQQLFPEVMQIIEKYTDEKTGRITYAPGVDRRELALEKYVRLLREHLLKGILPAAASKEAPLLPIPNRFKPFVSTRDVNYRTSRPTVDLRKSHLNRAAFRSEPEREAIEMLEELGAVASFAPNDRQIGLTLRYDYEGESRIYEPDFVIRLTNSKQLLLEIKGEGGVIHDPNMVAAKNAAAKKWVAAVNNAKRYGEWGFEICYCRADEKLDRTALREILSRHSGAAPILPFRIISQPGAADRWKTCVPLTTLKAAAGYWSEEQADLEGLEDIANEWITFECPTPFAPGMFVARVVGASMSPLIPNNSYCLFRPVPAGSRNGRRLLVWHEGTTDPETGGQYTVKVYESEKGAGADGEWEHTIIRLKPLNPDFQPIELTPEHEGQVRVLAEFVAVVGSAEPVS